MEGMTGTRKIEKKPKASYRHGNLKKALVDSALKTIRDSGEIEFSLRDLAEKVGVSHAAAYRHFKSKKEILFEIARDGFLGLGQSFERILKQDGADIVSLGVAYVSYATTHPDHFRVMFHPDLKIDSEHTDILNSGAKPFFMLSECVRLNKAAGKFANFSVQDLSIASWAMVHGLATLSANGHLDRLPNGERVKTKELSRMIAQILLLGLSKR